MPRMLIFVVAPGRPSLMRLLIPAIVPARAEDVFTVAFTFSSSPETFVMAPVIDAFFCTP